MEIWDLLDKNRQPLGVTHPRGQQFPMPPHTYHLAVSVFTLDMHNRLLLTLRDPNKRKYPGYWEYTGGSGIAGEDSITAARRELLEETGIDASPDDMIFLGAIREPTAFMDCYLVKLAIPGEDVQITLQEGETVDAMWVDLYTFDTMLQRGKIPPSCAMRYGFVRTALAALIGEDAWLSPTLEEAES